MTATKAAFGMRPLRRRGSAYNAEGVTSYKMANGFGQAIFYGDPVTFTTSGTIVLASTTGSVGYGVGVFLGCQYYDPNVGGRPTWKNYFPANTSSAPSPTRGTTWPIAFVLDSREATFAIQADASISSGDVGYNFQVSLGAGSTNTGMSSTVLKASTRKTAIELLQVVGIVDQPDNAWCDVDASIGAFPIVEVRWKNHLDNTASVA